MTGEYVRMDRVERILRRHGDRGERQAVEGIIEEIGEGSFDPFDIDEYQDWTEETAIEYATSETGGINREMAVVFLTLALNGEAGECAEKAKRVLRGDGDLTDMEDELGDVLWYFARLAGELEMDLSYIAQRNQGKLEDRQERGVIAGSGDDR